MEHYIQQEKVLRIVNMNTHNNGYTNNHHTNENFIKKLHHNKKKMVTTPKLNNGETLIGRGTTSSCGQPLGAPKQTSSKEEIYNVFF